MRLPWGLLRPRERTRRLSAAGQPPDGSGLRSIPVVEATEIAEKIHGEEHAAHRAEAEANFRKYTGIYLGIVAMLLAITALGGSNATKTMTNANIQASDIYGYYQAKDIRQAVYRLTAEQLEAELLAQPGMPDAARSKIEGAIKRYRDRAERYES